MLSFACIASDLQPVAMFIAQVLYIVVFPVHSSESITFYAV